MKIEVGKYYSLKMNLSGREVFYKGKILEIKNGEFRLETKSHYCERALTLKEKDILSFKEIPEPEKEEKVFKISKNKKFTNLKESATPDF